MVSQTKLNEFYKTELFVDSWKLIHKPNDIFEEKHDGKVEMIQKNSLLYLGHMLSKDSNNLPNIYTQKTHTQMNITRLAEPLALYKFESARCIMNQSFDI